MTINQIDKICYMAEGAETLAKTISNLVTADLPSVAITAAATLRQTADQILRILEHPENETKESQ